MRARSKRVYYNRLDCRTGSLPPRGCSAGTHRHLQERRHLRRQGAEVDQVEEAGGGEEDLGRPRIRIRSHVGGRVGARRGRSGPPPAASFGYEPALERFSNAAHTELTVSPWSATPHVSLIRLRMTRPRPTMFVPSDAGTEDPGGTGSPSRTVNNTE